MPKRNPQFWCALAVEPAASKGAPVYTLYVWDFTKPLEQGGFEKLAEIVLPPEARGVHVVIALDNEDWRLCGPWNGISGEVERIDG